MSGNPTYDLENSEIWGVFQVLWRQVELKCDISLIWRLGELKCDISLIWRLGELKHDISLIWRQGELKLDIKLDLNNPSYFWTANDKPNTTCRCFVLSSTKPFCLLILTGKRMPQDDVHDDMLSSISLYWPSLEIWTTATWLCKWSSSVLVQNKRYTG